MKACLVIIFVLFAVGGAAPADSNQLSPQDIYYEVMGKENPNTIIFVHGLDSSANTFSVIAGVLSQNFRVVIYDQRGHGRTIPKGLDYSPQTMAQDLETLRNYLGIERFAIYGHSLGARTALAYANRYPNRVSAFIAEDMEFFARMNPTPQKMQWILKQGQAIQKHIQQYHYPNLESLRQALSPIYFNQEKALSRVLTNRTQQNPDGSVDLLIHPYVSWLYGYQANVTDFSHELRQLKIPLLALKAAGMSGSALSLDGIKHLQRNKPDAHVEWIAGASHSIHLTHPRPVMELVEVFLTNGRVPINLRGKYAPKQERSLASLPAWVQMGRRPKAPLSVDAPPLVQNKFPRIAAMGVDVFGESLVEKGWVPRGTAVLTGSGAMVQSGIGGIIHLALASQPMGRTGFEPHLQSFVAAIKNAFRLASVSGVRRVALPFIGNGALIERMGVSQEAMAETLVRICLAEKQNLEVVFVLSTPGQMSLFREVLEKLAGQSRVELVQGSIADGRVHHASVILNPSQLDLKFGGGVSSLIATATGQPALIERETTQLVSAFNQSLLPFLR